MKKILMLALVLGCFSRLFSQQEILVPKEPSGKWLEGNELYIKMEDSVVVKLNFLETTASFWFLEIEITNTSTQQDILVDPMRFSTKIEDFVPKSTRDVCEPTIRHQPLSPDFLFNTGVDLRRQLKKNTVYPQKTLYGVMIVSRCRIAQSFRFNLPIGNRVFSPAFARQNVR
jgi:hypothetical protein